MYYNVYYNKDRLIGICWGYEKNVLVIEDAINEKSFLTEIIEKSFLDVRVYAVQNELEVFKRLKEKKISLVFISTKLKSGPGISLGQKIRRINEFKLLPIVFISDDIIHIVEAFKKVHCYDYLITPYSDEEIKGIVQVFLDHHSKYYPEKPSSFIEIKSGFTRKIYHDEINFIEYRERCCYIYLDNEVICWKGKSLHKVIDYINNTDIIQTHKSFAVNIRKIYKIEKISEKGWEIHFETLSEKALLGYKYKGKIVGRRE